MFSAEQALHQLESGGKEHPVAAFDKGLADGAEQVRFTAPGQAKGQDIMTLTLNGHSQKDIRDSVMTALRGQFRPELLNRIDEIIVFKPLGREEINYIVDIQLKSLRWRLRRRLGPFGQTVQYSRHKNRPFPQKKS